MYSHETRYGNAQGAQTDMRDLDFLAEVLSKHSSMVSILGSRHASLQIVRSFWQRGDVRGGLNAVLQSAGKLLLLLFALLGGECLGKMCQVLHEMYGKTSGKDSNIIAGPCL